MQSGVGFTFNITAGQLAVAATLLTLVGFCWRMLSRLDRMVWEHDLMWIEYAEKKGIPVGFYRSRRNQRERDTPPAV